MYVLHVKRHVIFEYQEVYDVTFAFLTVHLGSIIHDSFTTLVIHQEVGIIYLLPEVV